MKKTKTIFLTILTFLFCMSPIGYVHAADNASNLAGKNDNIANIVLFAYFQDEEEKGFFNDTSKKDPAMTNAQKIIDYYDGTSKRSLTNYVSAVSYGQLSVHNIFPQYNAAEKKVNPLELPFHKETAQKKDIDYEILKYIGTQNVTASGQMIDYDQDGMVDNVTVILLGNGANNVSTLPTLYPHMSTFNGKEQIDNKKIHSYNMLSTERIGSDETGVICHEFLHTLGYPDLYTTDSSLPVNNWDIMAYSSKYVSAPLSYLKMAISGWINMPTLTASQQQVSLQRSFENGGTQAVVLKSPNNPDEVFVVERREKGNPADPDSLDAAIGGSGIIVYRINTTVPNFSNYFGKQGVYVFRPQFGQNGHNPSSARGTLNNAFLSQEAGRTQMGSPDMDQGINDGAITFADGSNSGIIISNVSSAKGDTMTFDVSIPEASQNDVWKDTEITNSTNSSLIEMNGELMTLGYKKNTVTLFQYDSEQWKEKKNFQFIDQIVDLKPFVIDQKLGFAYKDENSFLHIILWDGNSLKELNGPRDIQEVSSFDVQTDANGNLAHLVYIQGNTDAFYRTFTASDLGKEINYHSSFCGDAKIVFNGRTTFIGVRDANKNDQIVLYEVSADHRSVKEIPSPGKARSYDLISYQGYLYSAMDTSSALVVKRFDKTKWNEQATLNTASLQPKLTIAKDTLCVLTNLSSNNGKEGLYVYALTKNGLEQEGAQVHRLSSNHAITSFHDQLFVTYTNEQKAYIQTKSIQNDLLSLEITPPAKNTCFVNEKPDFTGLQVFANYEKNKRELLPQEYQISTLDTSTACIKTVTISFNGLSSSFQYTVKEKPVLAPTTIDKISIMNIQIPAGGQKPVKELQVNEEGIQKAEIRWNPELKEGTFDFGKQYQAVITFTAKDGYAFSPAVNAFVKDAKHTDVQWINDQSIRITAHYEATIIPSLTADKTIALQVGEHKKVQIHDETNSGLTWTNDAPSIISIDQEGHVHGLQAGNATIKVKNAYGKEATILVQVTHPKQEDGNTTNQGSTDTAKKEETANTNSPNTVDTGTTTNWILLLTGTIASAAFLSIALAVKAKNKQV